VIEATITMRMIEEDIIMTIMGIIIITPMFTTKRRPTTLRVREIEINLIF
jgi:hypothetical protein